MWQAYLREAAFYLGQSRDDNAGVDSISGIWVSSDDSSVLAEVQQHAPNYFPNVPAANITTISFQNVSPGEQFRGGELPTHSNSMVCTLL